MKFEIGDEVMYNSCCEYEHNELLCPKKSIGKVIDTDPDMFSEHGGAILKDGLNMKVIQTLGGGYLLTQLNLYLKKR